MNSGSTSNIDPDWESRLVEYSLGQMGAEAASEFERSLNECRAHVIMARQYLELTGALGLATHPAEPPAGHKARFLARLGATPQETLAGAAAAMPAPGLAIAPAEPGRPTVVGAAAPREAGEAVTDLAAYRERRRAGGAWRWVAAAAALVLLVVAGFGWLSADRARVEAEQEAARQRTERERLAQVMQQQLNELVAERNKSRDLEEQLVEAREKLNIPSDWVAFPVPGTEEAPDAWAVAFVNPKTNEAFVMTQKLRPLSQAQLYELWWLPRGFPNQPPVSAQKFPVDEQGRERLENLKAPGNVADFVGLAVSLEPVPDPDPAAPSGPIVMAGTFEVP